MNGNDLSTFTITLNITNSSNYCNTAIIASIDCYLLANDFKCFRNSVKKLTSECKVLLEDNCYSSEFHDYNKTLNMNETCYSQGHINLCIYSSYQQQFMAGCCFINISDNLQSSTVPMITHSMDNNGKLLS